MLLSIITPFFNAEQNSKRLLKTLSIIDQKDVEVILINDGSTDNTYSMLKDFKSSASVDNVIVIDQDNQGPGGARNSGLNIATGEYVWFVDCDDDIKLQAIDTVREVRDKSYDFIDFNIENKTGTVNSMKIDAGEYNNDNTPELSILLLNSFGRIWSKIIRGELITANDIYYPEYCLYEDNPLVCIYPFFTKSFLKTNTVGYIHQEEYESITRSKPSLKILDRLHTSIYGLEQGLSLARNEKEVKLLEEYFIYKYLIATSILLYSKKPSRNWLVIWRVMRQYRILAKEFGIKTNALKIMQTKSYNTKFQAYFMSHWFASQFILTNQKKHFENINKINWPQ